MLWICNTWHVVCTRDNHDLTLSWLLYLHWCLLGQIIHYSTTPSSVGSWPPSSCLLVQMRRQQTSPVIIFLRVPVLAAVRWGGNQMFHAYLMRIFSFPANWGAEEPRSLAAAMAWTCCEGCWLQPFSHFSPLGDILQCNVHCTFWKQGWEIVWNCMVCVSKWQEQNPLL